MSYILLPVRSNIYISITQMKLGERKTIMQFENLSALYQYFDDLVCQDDNADVLFASSYIRGFISLSASGFGDETQVLTEQLADDVTDKLEQAKTELSPQDREIIKLYWHDLKAYFTS